MKPTREQILEAALRWYADEHGCCSSLVNEVLSGVEPPEIKERLSEVLEAAADRCDICKKIVVQSSRGKRRKYCSAKCQAKGIPSAKKRGEYVRAYRERRRAHDLEIAQAALRRAWPGEEYEALSESFPDRPRRAILYLLRKTRRSA